MRTEDAFSINEEKEKFSFRKYILLSLYHIVEIETILTNLFIRWIYVY
jgi:hypothetical protein